MGLFFPSSSRKPTTPLSAGMGSPLAHKFDRNSRGRIIPNEMPGIRRKLISTLGYHKAERIIQGLEAHMDSDWQWGGKNVGARESEQLLDTLRKSHHDTIDRDDIDKAKEIFSGYQ